MAVRDIRYLLQKRAEQTLTGTYYEERPTTPQDGGTSFRYEYIDPSTWAFRRVFGNVIGSEYSNAAIRTVAALPWKVDGFIVTQDGKLYTIVQVEKDPSAVGKQAQRLWVAPAGITYAIRMIEVDNPWESV